MPVPPSAQESERIWGGVYERARCLALGLTVDDLGAAEQALAGVDVGVHQRVDDGSVVLDPTPLPFPVVLTEALLPGDPRT